MKRIIFTVSLTLSLLFSSSLAHAEMQLFVRTLTGQTIAISVQNQDLVHKVKQLVHKKMDIPIDDQQIIFAGQELIDQRTLASYEIQPFSTLHLVIKNQNSLDIKIQ